MVWGRGSKARDLMFKALSPVLVLDGCSQPTRIVQMGSKLGHHILESKNRKVLGVQTSDI